MMAYLLCFSCYLFYALFVYVILLRMQKASIKLPDDIDALKELVLNKIALSKALEEENKTRTKEVRHYKAKVLSLQEQLNLLLHKRFGTSSEKCSVDQLKLFDEAEQETESIEQQAEEQSIAIVGHQRKKSVRKPLPKNLPREQVIHDLAEDEKTCPHDGHALKEIGRDVSEQLEYIPATVKVIEHVRLKYACPCCEQGIKIAPLPAQVIPKSFAGPGLLAHVAVSKYEDGLPLYRQEKQWQRLGVELGRGTLSNWMIRCGSDVVQPLINLLREQLLSTDYIQMDETPVQVLNEPGKTPQSQSYMWVQRGGPPSGKIILFEYEPSRSRLLSTHRAIAFITVGCFAHARRKLFCIAAG